MYQRQNLLVWGLIVLKIANFHVSANITRNDAEGLSRSKRLVYYTHENRLTLPPGTEGFVVFAIRTPFARNIPPGYVSQLDMQLTAGISFDDLGYTSLENPWGLWPDFGLFRKKRQAWEPMEGVNWAGGDREMIFQIAEECLTSRGMEGKPCLLRAICEVFETPLLRHGLFGEILQLISSVSNSIGAAERLGDYLTAEELGRKHKSCSKYYAGCSKSLFTHNAQRMNDTIHIERTHNYEGLSRPRRLVHYSHDNRLTLPPDTRGLVVLGLDLPSIRNIPTAYRTNMEIRIPSEIIFDDLGLTSEENPWGLWQDFGLFRKKRQAWEPMDGVNWAGGDREMAFQVAEDYLTNLGMNGKPCLLRAICEVFETPLLKHGLFGEIFQLIFSVSKSIGAAERLPDYLEAEELGRKHKSCSKYYVGCSKSLFTHNAQRMKDTTPIERSHHCIHKMSKEDSEQRRNSMSEKVNELLELRKLFKEF